MKIIIDKIESNSRDNIYYIDSITSLDTICKNICAFANTDGGELVFGIYDDGNSLKEKGFSFIEKFNEYKLNIIDLFKELNLEFGSFDYLEKKIMYISIAKSEKKISFKNIFYKFSESKELITMDKKKIFMSYCHQDKCIADIIEEKLEKEGNELLEIGRDINKLKYKDSIENYMNSINEYDFVVSIVSDSYLKSQPCMYEIIELMKNRAYYDKLLYLVLSNEDIKYYTNEEIKEENIKANIYSHDRFKYALYWQSEIEKLNGILDEFKGNREATVEVTEELRKIKRITLDINEFMDKLKDGLGIGFKDMNKSNFKELTDIIFANENKPN